MERILRPHLAWMSARVNPNRAKQFWPVAVLGLAAFLFFARLGSRAVWSEELRWVEIPREMLLNGDHFQPTINGHSYYDKPLGSYWLVLAAAEITGAVN